MEVLYIDRLFVLNALTDYLLCLVTARVCGLCLRRRRYLAAALFGAVYAVAAVLPGFAFLSGPLWKLIAALLMGWIAYGGEARMLRCTGVFVLVSAAFGGMLWAVTLAGETLWPGRGAQTLSLRALLLAFALCYLLVSLLLRRRGRLPSLPREEVCVELLGRRCRFMALVDTGNALYDPLSGCAVMLVTPQAVAPLFPQLDGLWDESDPVALLERIDRCDALKGRFRLIPYRAVGAKGLLPLFRADRISVGGRERRDLLLAVSPGASGDGFEGILQARED